MLTKFKRKNGQIVVIVWLAQFLVALAQLSLSLSHIHAHIIICYYYYYYHLDVLDCFQVLWQTHVRLL